MFESLIILGTFGFVFFTILALFAGERVKKPQERIMHVLGREEQSEAFPPLKERVRLMILKLTVFFPYRRSKDPKGQNSRDTNSSGSRDKEDGENVKGLQYGLGLLLGLVILVLSILLRTSTIMRLGGFVLGFLIGYLFPKSWSNAQMKKKQLEIERSLPDVLDLLTVSVEAGLGFDAALLKVVEKQKGALAEEFLKVLQEIKMGRPRRDALRDLSKRNPIEDLSNVVASLVQADQLGIPIAGVLRNQSKQIRQKHRQRAEEKAQKAPVKMMIPLVFFVFPSVFIIILGPAVIQIIDMFSKQ
ncbi:type II secretion system F family protein [Desulfitobacterium metallireducens]|uniref:type II secretion system F family protein n=1 Tax=Desulfitobacterium metallireducens TaxID=142877 RepID=UPI0002314231|nr:type II secretion system F family protein [Desulfitobacterium metallireducens]